jgi:hypothetical protein
MCFIHWVFHRRLLRDLEQILLAFGSGALVRFRKCSYNVQINAQHIELSCDRPFFAPKRIANRISAAPPVTAALDIRCCDTPSPYANKPANRSAAGPGVVDALAAESL